MSHVNTMVTHYHYIRQCYEKYSNNIFLKNSWEFAEIQVFAPESKRFVPIVNLEILFCSHSKLKWRNTFKLNSYSEQLNL